MISGRRLQTDKGLAMGCQYGGVCGGLQTIGGCGAIFNLRCGLDIGVQVMTAASVAILPVDMDEITGPVTTTEEVVKVLSPEIDKLPDPSALLTRK